MQSRLQGEQELQFMIRDIFAKAESHISKVVQKKQAEAEEKLKVK